jgi:hypothetical protein
MSWGNYTLRFEQHECNLRNGGTQLPLEEQLCSKPRQFIEANIPELAGKVQVKVRCGFSFERSARRSSGLSSR